MTRYDERAKEIGRRIKKERKDLGLNIKEFLIKICMSESSYKTISAWERGDRIPDLTSLVKMAELFDCDIGYLLCDFDEKKHITADIKEQTGLSEKAILSLLKLNPKKIAIDVLSSILVQPEVAQWLTDIYRIAIGLSICNHLEKASTAERLEMENKKFTTLSESVLAHMAIPEIECAQLQESKRHNKILDGVTSDLCRTNDNIKELGANRSETLTSDFKKQYGLEEKKNG